MAFFCLVVKVMGDLEGLGDKTNDGAGRGPEFFDITEKKLI